MTSKEQGTKCGAQSAGRLQGVRPYVGTPHAAFNVDDEVQPLLRDGEPDRSVVDELPVEIA